MLKKKKAHERKFLPFINEQQACVAQVLPHTRAQVLTSARLLFGKKKRKRKNENKTKKTPNLHVLHAYKMRTKLEVTN